MNTVPYKLPLKVSNVRGRRVWVNIFKLPNDKVKITSEYIPNIKKDNPKFSKDGKINIIVDRKNYKETKNKLTKYLESLFLKELANEDIHSSVRTDNAKVGNVEKNKSGTNEKDNTGEGGASSVYSGSGGNKPTESSEQ